MPIEPESEPTESLCGAGSQPVFDLHDESQAQAQPTAGERVRSPGRIPNLAHAILFGLIAFLTLFITEIAGYGAAIGLRIFGHEPADQILREPRLLIPTMAVSYLIAAALSWAIFSNMWKRPFPRAIHWRGTFAAHRLYFFIPLGLALSVLVQVISNFLPIPKVLPIDDFFRTSTDVWLIALFGVFLAPAFEELAFRGFLFPALASAWDWLRGRSGRYWISSAASPDSDPAWSTGAIVFSSTLTSIGFTLLHADQLAHSWAPLIVLFGVSIVLCMVRLRAHSLAASAIVHASYNAAIFALLFFATGGFRHLDKINQ